MKSYRMDLIICLIMILATLVVFWRLPSHEFVGFDDDVYVYENLFVQKGLSEEGFTWAFKTFRTGNWHPLTWLSHMLDCQLFGLDPGMHHLTNLFFHIANSLLLYLVLRKMTGTQWRSAFVASLFALHPLHVESVAWVAERKDVLSTFFWLLTMWSYAFYTERPAVNRYMLTLLFFALGLMAKPMLVTLPFVLLLTDYWPLHRVQMFRFTNNRQARKFSSFQLIWEKVPFFTLATASIVVTLIAQKAGGAVTSLDVLPIKIRIANAFISYISYIAKMIWPRNLAVLYPMPNIFLAWQAAVAGLLLFLISLVLIRAMRRRPYLGVGWFWYIGTLFPVIGLVQVGVQSMADRYTYVPLIGLFILLTWGVHDLMGRWRHGRIVAATCAALTLLGFMAGASFQVRHWKTSTTLFTHALGITSNNWLMHYNLGVTLAKEGKLNEAISHYSEALRIKKNYAIAHNNLGVALTKQGKLNEAISHYSEALRIKKNYAIAHNNLGVALRLQGRLDEAIMHHSEALRIRSDFPKAHNNLGIVLSMQGKTKEAIDHYSEALHIDPDNPEAHNNLGILLDAQGEWEKAIRHYSEALRINPDYAKAHFNLAGTLLRQKRVEEAVGHLYDAVRINPNYERAHFSLGVVLMHLEKRKEASFHFSEVTRINPKNGKAYYFLELLSD
jgi:tetratricopeptide (TPR) repeat protein